jgi:hypothetical protein
MAERAMGIKDWLSSIGDKQRKQAELREKVKDAVSDGKLSATDIHDIRSLQAELEVDPPAADKTQVRRALFNDAFDAVRARGGVTSTGIQELHKIQKFLGLRDDQIDKAKFEMQRLKTLAEIRKGNLPLVPPSNVALREIPLEAGEVAHYTLGVDILDQSSTRGLDGVPVAWGKPYEEGAARVHVLPEDGAREVGEATLVVTNRRMVLKTPRKVAAVQLSPQAQIFLYSDGVRLQRTMGNTLLRFRSGSDETSEILGEILAAVMKSA